ncbi:hypothetical protein FRB91_005981 [Serendipita sp. 411]|nr:hypothetical protein FRC16_003176 [Serendipita sp. 398]KAG8840518.1 hypothetical protein FRB91_005981 [Serendipita sp. 411]KAG8861259.1 hypothetical protein FRC20_011488 [Serendipita sp. 405]
MGQTQSSSSSSSTVAAIGSAGGVLINSAASILKNATTALPSFSSEQYDEDDDANEDTDTASAARDQPTRQSVVPRHRSSTSTSSTNTGVISVHSSTHPGSDRSYPVSSILFIGSSQPCSPGYYAAAAAAAASVIANGSPFRVVWSPSGHGYALSSADLCVRSTTRSLFSQLSISEENECEMTEVTKEQPLSIIEDHIAISANPLIQDEDPSMDEGPHQSYDTVVLIDDSSPVAPTVWRDTINLTERLMSDLDVRGGGNVQLHFINDSRSRVIRTVSKENRLFDELSKKGQMSITEKLDELMGEYFMSLRDSQSVHQSENCKENLPRRAEYILLLHNPPIDDIEPILIFVAKNLDAGRFPLNQLQLRFIQIGTDPTVTETMQRVTSIAERHNVRQIVQTYNYAKDTLALAQFMGEC